MTFTRSLVDHLPHAIAVITDTGTVEYKNRAFDSAFGNDAASWLSEAARTVAGERGWLHGFFAEGDDSRTIDVEIEGRVYRIDRILRLDEEGKNAVALSFEDVTRQRRPSASPSA
jgi:PAS domain-containing protein